MTLLQFMFSCDPKSLSQEKQFGPKCNLNVIGKVFEQLLFQCLGCAFIYNSLGSLQGGGKPDFTCLDTSLILQEVVSYMVKKGQSVLCGTAGSRSTCDVVLYNGLYLKSMRWALKLRDGGF